MRAWLGMCILIASQMAYGRSVSLDLITSSTFINSSQLIRNTAKGFLHPPIEIAGHDAGTTPINLGDGSDGAFDSSTYAAFASQPIVSNVIVIDTDVRTELNVTNFTLEAGYTLRPEGSQPLKIRVLGDVVINGDIDCSGGDGSPSESGGTSTPAGGAGRCGGYDGGNGASVVQNAEDGTPSASIAGSGGGRATNTSSGGGGGGGFTEAATDGADGFGANPGLAGNVQVDRAFTILEGGAGGGGGEDGTGPDSGGGGRNVARAACSSLAIWRSCGVGLW
ncbi:MAG: hypothetical protein R2827_09195 [Bdellovibrionales bacterium]